MFKACAIIVTLLLSGCAGQHCFLVEGSRGDDSGKFQYCYDAKESQEVKSPVLIAENGDKYISLSEEEIKQIEQKLQKAEQAESGTKGAENKALVKDTPDLVQSLLSRVRK